MKRFNYIWLPFILVLMFLLSGCSNRVLSNSPEINKGLLNLQQWDIDSRNITLDGEWEFYWQKPLSYNDLCNNNLKPDLYAEVPRVWNTYQVNGQSLPGFGTATYRLRVNNTTAGQELAIRMPTVSTAYKLYINERLIASNGKVGIDKEHFLPEYRPVMAEFISPSTNFDIILQVANFSYARGGMWYPIIMGPVSQIVEYDKTIGYKDLFLLGTFFIMALYYLCIFLLRKEDRVSLYFVLMCLIAMGRTVIFGDYIINKVLPWAGYRLIVTVDYVTLVWFPVVFVLLIEELFPEQVSQKLKRVFIVYAALMSLFIILSPIYLYTSLSYPIEGMLLAIVAYAVICSVRAFQENKVDSAIIFIGALAAALGGVHDVLYQNNIISSSFGEFSPFGFLVLLFLQAIILARRFSKAFDDSRLLSEKLMRLDEMKDDFLANTSHELRTPLNAIVNVAQGISQGADGPVNEKQQASLSLITASGKRLTHLINDILDYSKLKNYELQMNLEPVSLKRVVESVLHILERLDKSKDVGIYSDIPEGLPYINADENRILQIMYNLVGNALKFTSTGYVKVSARQVGEYVESCVEDTGSGIPQDKLDSIFISFQQLEDSLTRKHGGAGLGLPISKQLVEAHGGQMWVESKPGQGSKFFFTVPIYRGAVEEELSHSGPAEIDLGGLDMPQFPLRHKAEGAHIMLVDDSPANLIALSNILKMNNYSLTALSSSDQFFAEFAREKDVSLLILDVMMPDLSGYDICREIRKTYSVAELPVLMLTARVSINDMLLGMDCGANDYLTKPFDTQELMARVKTLIQLKETVEKAKTAEMAFLQAQIKPHFLYNALNTVVSISRYDIDKARNLIIEFGNYLRRSFDFRELSQLVPLKNELELVRAYVAIEKARFEERLEVDFDLPDELEMQIPMLIIQPLVENAVIHGILPGPQGGKIDILVKRDEKYLHIRVKDNGVGIDEEKLKDLITQDHKGGVGLYNIDKRLKQLYGRGLEIESRIGRGTEVNLYIPIKREVVNYDKGCIN